MSFQKRDVHGGNIYSRLRVRATRVVSLIFPLHVWMYLSLIFRAQFSSIDAYCTRDWAYLHPQTWSVRVLAFGRTAPKSPIYRCCSLFEFDLTILVDPFGYFRHSGMPSVFNAFVRLSVIMMIHFEPALLTSVVLLMCSTTSVRFCWLVFTIPYLSTFRTY